MAGRLGQLKSNGGGAKTYLDSPKGVGQKTLNNNTCASIPVQLPREFGL